MKELKKKVEERARKIQLINQKKKDKETEIAQLRAREDELKAQGTDDVDTVLTVRKQISEIEHEDMQVIQEMLSNAVGKSAFTMDEFNERWDKRAIQLNKQLDKPIENIYTAFKALQTSIIEYNKQKSIINEEVTEWGEMIQAAGYTLTGINWAICDGLGLPECNEFKPCHQIPNVNKFEGNSAYHDILYSNDLAIERTKLKCLPNCYGREPGYRDEGPHSATGARLLI